MKFVKVGILWTVPLFIMLHLSLFISYITYEIGGRWINPLLYFLNYWFLILIKKIDGDLHESLLQNESAYLNGLIISAVSWLVISPLVGYIAIQIRRIRFSQKSKKSMED